MFKRFFNLIKANTTAVQMVEAMKECGLTNHVLETLPEAILIPLQDAIALCQPHPPSSWSDEMLDLVKRTDISLILTSNKRHRPAMSNILVSYLLSLLHALVQSINKPIRRQHILQVGSTSYSVKVLSKQIVRVMTKVKEPSDKL